MKQGNVMRNHAIPVGVVLMACAGLAWGQKAKIPPNSHFGTVIRVANLYVQPDEQSARVSVITPGREMAVAEKSGNWLRVFANTDVEEERTEETPEFGSNEDAPAISGWILDKGIVDVNTPKGDTILFGEADTAERLADEPHAPPRAAQDARLMYRRLVEIFPQSTWTPEAAWRAADIRWQVQKLDVFSRPSAHEKESWLREQLNEDDMKKLQKKYPHTKWADLAAYDMLDNKMCGDWQGSEKCPVKESEIFVKYAEEHPDSPKAPEALYEAAWRQASAGDMYNADGDGKKADESRAHAKELAGRIEQKYPQSEYTARVAGLIYKMEQSIPIYGSERE
jgi:hypothetical protein